jgi:hypothetical protein
MTQLDLASRVDSLKSQLDFARHVFDTQQAAIRHLDSKAGFFITLLVFLATGTLAIARDACTRLHWTGRGSLPSWIYVTSSLLFVAGFLTTAWCVNRVIRPRASPAIRLPNGLVFSRDVVAHLSAEKYHHAVEHTSDELLLNDLNIQIFNLATIVKQKNDALQVAWWPTIFCFAAWATNGTVAIYVLSRHEALSDKGRSLQ